MQRGRGAEGKELVQSLSFAPLLPCSPAQECKVLRDVVRNPGVSAQYELRKILFYRLNQGYDPPFIICIRQWEGVLVKTRLFVTDSQPYSQDDAS
ncbi:hypothetical protein CDG79_27545 [Nostoc sp. 'Peltigera membranacea cyanobiont' 232]|nr:hypothetical protein CDG79_27545 [Nostoc sp. 'Peltigera membranacea cyanobiont' 232]